MKTTLSICALMWLLLSSCGSNLDWGEFNYEPEGTKIQICISVYDEIDKQPVDSAFVLLTLKSSVGYKFVLYSFTNINGKCFYDVSNTSYFTNIDVSKEGYGIYQKRFVNHTLVSDTTIYLVPNVH